MRQIEKSYLGDGVYLEIDEYNCVVLTTENGISITNRIFLKLDIAIDLATRIMIKCKTSK